MSESTDAAPQVVVDDDDVVVAGGDAGDAVAASEEHADAATPTTEQTKGKGEAEEATTKPCDFCYSEIPIKAKRCRFCSANLVQKTSEDGNEFTVLREEITDEKTGFVSKSVKVRITDDVLKRNLKSYMNQNPEFFEKEPVIDATELFACLPRLRDAHSSYSQSGMANPFASIMAFIEEEFQEMTRAFEAMRSDGVITFACLQLLFQRGTKIVGKERDWLIGSEVAETQYAKSLFMTFFVITGEMIKSSGDKFYSFNHKFIIPQFKGAKKLDELPVQVASEEVLAQLTERGRVFNEVGVGAHYQCYEGKMQLKMPTYTLSWRADGRIMIDGNSFNKMNPNYSEFNPSYSSHSHYNGGGGNMEQDIKELPEASWFKTWPTIGGFSFSVKRWGEVVLDNISPVTFDESAFDRLVLPAEKKALIRALVEHSDESTFTDIIRGKGSGCILLAHGPPGVGKTLTAEATAELLHRPLYSVSVGELGTTVDALEQKLSDLLEVAAVWKSVILIDEADIFLERRTEKEIKRNAMVGIFLRLLEYHQGILVLTTNRVKSFDRAFHSRISVAIRYPKLDDGARAQVWTNLLDAAGILDGMDVNALAQHDINGRQIRTTVRLAQALAQSEGLERATQSHLERCVMIALQFQHDLILGEDD